MNLLDQFAAYPMALRDMVALAFLFISWLGIGWFTERPPAGRPSVSVLMTRYRREWMRHFVDREPRIFDGNILASLREGTAFFASACMIATGGLLALIGNGERLRSVASGLELNPTSDTGWELRLLVPMFFVVNAFLKFVWAHRLFGYCAVMMASVPNDPEDPLATIRAHQAAEINVTAAKSYNMGLRNIYFSLAALGWLVGPWGLFVTTAFVLGLTWRREFASHSRQIMLHDLPRIGKI